MKCDKCGNIATVHLTEVNRRPGTKTQSHLCDDCAKAVGLPIPEGGTQKLLEEFVKEHSPKEPPRGTDIEPRD